MQTFLTQSLLPMTITMRACTASDLKDLQRISIDTFVETFGPHNTEENMKNYVATSLSAEQLAKEVGTPGSYFSFVFYDGELAGYLKLNEGDAQTDPMGENAFQIERIYLLKRYQRKGIGKFLVEYSLGVAREHKRNPVWLGVWEHNHDALAFYRKMGFVETGAHEFDLGDDHQRDLIMELKLE